MSSYLSTAPESSLYYNQQQQNLQQAPFSAPPTFSQVNGSTTKSKTFNSPRYSLDGIYGTEPSSISNFRYSEGAPQQGINNRLPVSNDNNTERQTVGTTTTSGLVSQNLSGTTPSVGTIRSKITSLQTVLHQNSDLPQYPTAITRLYSNSSSVPQTPINQYYQQQQLRYGESHYTSFNSASTTPQYSSYSYPQQQQLATNSQQQLAINPQQQLATNPQQHNYDVRSVQALPINSSSTESYYQQSVASHPLPQQISFQQHRHSIDGSNTRNYYCTSNSNMDGSHSEPITQHRVPIYGNSTAGYGYLHGSTFGPTSGYADLDYWDQIKSNVDRPMVNFKSQKVLKI